MRRASFFILCIAGALFVSRPAPSATGCATCHPSEAKLHAKSAHASALGPVAGSQFALHLPAKPLAEAADGFRFMYQTTADGLNVTAAKGTERATAPLKWIFGSGRQGQTPVLFYQGRFLEHRVSLYAATGYGITIGQENGISANAIKALGAAQSDRDARACFACHATSVSADLTQLTPGVQCIRCHAGAEEHAVAAQSGSRRNPVNPGKLDHLAQVQLCGECHRNKPPSGDENDIGNVRFQPLRLMKSACFRASQIECTTCHPAHRDAQSNAHRDAHRDADRNDPDAYNRACLGCHAVQQMAHAAQQKSGDCVGCHMPKATPAPALTFTDHYIRVPSKRVSALR